MRYSLALATALLACAASASPVHKRQEVVTVVVTAANIVTVTAGQGPPPPDPTPIEPVTVPEPVIEAPSSAAPSEPAPTAEAPAPAAPEGDFAKNMLDWHNKYRALVGAPALEWSDEIAKTSQSRADTCYFDHVEGTPYGENLSANPSADAPTQAVFAWYTEGKNFVGEGASDFHATGHFTQVVWEGSTKLGCATTQCGDLRFPDGEPWKDMQMIVCNYDPAGNFGGQYGENVPTYVRADNQGNKCDTDGCDGA